MTPGQTAACPLRRALTVTALASLLPSTAGAGTLRERMQNWREQRQGNNTHATVMRDLAYGPQPLQKLDVYLPKPGSRAGQPPSAVLVMVHGGAWRFGDKGNTGVVKNKVTRWVGKGLVLVSVNYRLVPDVHPLEQARDVARALRLVQERAADWGADPAQCVLMGHSAGAHLVALLAATPDIARESGAAPWLGTIALDSAAMDVAALMRKPHPALYDTAFGTDPAFWEQVSPLRQLQAGARPILAVCSSRRPDAMAQAQALALRGQAAGVRIEVLPQDLSHEDINENLGLPGPYTLAVETFLASLSGSMKMFL